MPDTQPLLIQRLINWLVQKAKENRLPLCSALIFGFLAHGFAFTNKLVNHDEVHCLFEKGSTVASGRWGLCFMDNLFPNVSMPWIYGIITIFLLAVSVCILVQLLPLRSRLAQVLAAGLVMSFPSLTGTFGYMFTSTSYGVAFLLTVLAARLIEQPDRRLWIVGLGCLVFALGIYQAYIGICAGLLVICIIHRLLDGENPAAVLRRGLGYIGFLALSLGLYYGLAQLTLALSHQTMSSYAADSLAFSPLALPRNIGNAYWAFFSVFRHCTHRLIPTLFSRGIHILLLLCGAVLLLIRAKPLKNLPAFLLLALALVLFPLAVCCTYLFVAPESIHTLVLYSFVDVYLLILMLAEGCPPCAQLRRLVLNLLPILCAVIVTINIYIANASYLTLYLRYENAYAFYTALVADIHQSPEFTEGSRLAVIGTWKDPVFYEEHLEFTNTLMGVTGFKPDSYSRERFWQHYIGSSVPMASEAEIQEIAASPEFATMPVYPYYGSLQKIGDTFVVKLSN